jgi:serine/threonine-protein kinase RsbW
LKEGEDVQNREAEIEIASSYNTLSLIRSFIRTYLDVENISESDKVKFVSVIDELTTNVIEHAYSGEDREENIVKIQIRIDESTLYAKVEDYGSGFKNNNKSKEEGGFGLKIVEGIVETIKIFPKDKGTIVEVTKKVKEEEIKNAY